MTDRTEIKISDTNNKTLLVLDNTDFPIKVTKNGKTYFIKITEKGGLLLV